MLTADELKHHARASLDRLLAGERVIVSCEVYDAIIDHYGDECRDMASAHNAKQLGTRDELVAWIGAARPEATYRQDGRAYASA